MALKDKDLQFLLRGKCRKPACPADKDFVRFFSGEMADPDKEPFLDHVLGCASCGPLFEMLGRLSVALEPLLAGDDRWALNEEEATRLRRLAGERLAPAGRSGRLAAWFRSPARLASALAAVLLLAAGGVFFLLRPPQPAVEEEDVYRGGEQVLELMAPRGEAERSGLVFTWQTFPRAETYLFEILSDDLSVVWRNGILRETRIRPPDGILAGLKKGAPYFWKITAYGSAGQELGVGLQSFLIK